MSDPESAGRRGRESRLAFCVGGAQQPVALWLNQVEFQETADVGEDEEGDDDNV